MNSFSHIHLKFLSLNLLSESKSAIYPVKLWLSRPLRIHNRFFGPLPQLKLFFDKPSFLGIELSQNIIAEFSCPLVELQNKKNILLLPVRKQFCLEFLHLFCRQKTFEYNCLTSGFKHLQDCIAWTAHINKSYIFIFALSSWYSQV